MKYVDKEDITRKHDLTAEELKSLPMFAHFTDEQAEEAIDTIKTFVDIAFNYYKKDKEKQGNDTDF
ncbi:hypothetical protein [Sphingobacterium daejeonense]|uniref:hypothetical protein n=1 Tax=Sphingobacterium daejeonense TaxID=371142 RepID=UPI0010C45797|nr:hypothetical protein [Sphingobacterium daejeonense]VTP91283.1 Uncharacterised protein [Sphingobacterium daejeonense]